MIVYGSVYTLYGESQETCYLFCMFTCNSSQEKIELPLSVKHQWIISIPESSSFSSLMAATHISLLHYFIPPPPPPPSLPICASFNLELVPLLAESMSSLI